MAFSIKYSFRAIDKFSPVIDKISKKTDKISKKFDRLGKSLSLRLTAPILALGIFAIKSASDMEKLNIRFATMLRSTEKAKKLMKILVDFTAKTPFQLKGVGDATAILLSFGTELNKIPETLKFLGDTAAGTGKDLKEIAVIFGQVRAVGKLTGERFLQLAERGIPIQKVLAEVANVSEKVIPKAISEGLISFDLVQKAFKKMTKEGGIFNDAMKKLSETTPGIFSTLRDVISLASAKLGEIIIKVFDLKTKFKTAIRVIESATEKLNNLAETNPGLVKLILTLVVIAAAAGPVLIALGLLAKALVLVGAGLAFIFSPITLIVAGIGLLGFAIFKLVKNFDRVKEFFSSLGKGILNDLLVPIRLVIDANILLLKLLSKIPGVGKIFEFGAGKLEDLKSKLEFTTPFVNQKIEGQTNIDINLNAPPGVIESIRQKSKGLSNLNIGQTTQLAPATP